jgi:hypothetical protein
MSDRNNLTNLELYKQVLEEVKTSAETNSALALGPGAVHNLWLAIQEIGRAAEPTEDARSIGHSMRQCLLRKQPIPDALLLSALTYLDPPSDSSVGPWCDNCGQDEDAHVGPELKCPPENREGKPT